MKDNLVETLVGAVVLLVAGSFLAYAYTTVGSLQDSDGYQVVAYFDRVDGLSNGSDVRLAGIKIGQVESQSIDPKDYKAIIVMSIQSDVKLPEDSSAKITSEGLLGSNYISVQPGGSEDFLASGDEIFYTQGSVDLVSLLGQAVFNVSDDNPSSIGSSGSQ
ncbi:MAG: outer membrane lipid asymmetry maintenance protein MlaD [Parvularculales bacterium]